MNMFGINAKKVLEESGVFDQLALEDFTSGEIDDKQSLTTVYEFEDPYAGIMLDCCGNRVSDNYKVIKTNEFISFNAVCDEGYDASEDMYFELKVNDKPFIFKGFNHVKNDKYELHFTLCQDDHDFGIVFINKEDKDVLFELSAYQKSKLFVKYPIGYSNPLTYDFLNELGKHMSSKEE